MSQQNEHHWLGVSFELVNYGSIRARVKVWGAEQLNGPIDAALMHFDGWLHIERYVRNEPIPGDPGGYVEVWMPSRINLKHFAIITPNPDDDASTKPE